MGIECQIMVAEGMDLIGVIAEFDEEVDQISGDVFMHIEGRAQFAVDDIGPNEGGVVFIAGFRDEDGMGVEMVEVEPAQMEACELFHDFEAESHADA